MPIVFLPELATTISVRLSLLKSPTAMDRGCELELIELLPILLNVSSHVLSKVDHLNINLCQAYRLGEGFPLPKIENMPTFCENF